MRHLKKGRKFGRERDQRWALMKSLATSLFMHGKIKTTEAKSKELRPLVEKMLTRGKNPTVANRRELGRMLSNRVVDRVVSEAKHVANRPGGYTRIIKLGARKSDSARMALIELVK